jgi:predicted phosphodiesterase
MHPRYAVRTIVALVLLIGGIQAPFAQDIALPNRPDSLKFAIIGDSGTGSDSQLRVADTLTASRAKFPYEFVLMMGDNLYSGSGPKDYQKKFEKPYKTLLDSGLKFYAALGNHDNPDERNYKPFNMGGQKYYTFKPKNGVRIFALDSNYMDPPQLQWLEKELAASGSDWKICFFHHPLYSSGMHGSNDELRAKLEPLFLKYGVDAVFSGHEHFYERIKPQKGIYYFTSGGAAKLREGDVSTKSELTEKSFDTGYHFMLIELTKDALNFQTISDQGKTVDSGVLPRFSDQDKKKFATP